MPESTARLRDQWWRPLIFEGLIPLAVVGALGMVVQPEDRALAGIVPHPYSALVFFAALRHGSAVAGPLGLIAAVAYLLLALLDQPLADISVAPLAWSAVAVGASLIVDRHLRRITDLEARFVPRAPTTASPTGTLRTLYRYARQLNVVEETAVFTGLIAVLEDALPAERVTIYAVAKNGELRRRFGHGPPASPLPVDVTERLLNDGGLWRAVLRNGMSEMAGAVRAGADGPVIALLVIDGVAADRPVDVVERLLTVFLDWASASVAQARQFAALPDAGRQRVERMAEARGRAAARRFARTGKLLDDSDDETMDELRHMDRQRDTPSPLEAVPFVPVGPNEPPPASTAPAPRPEPDADDTERVATPLVLADALAEAPAADFRPRPRAPRRGEAGSLVVPAARAANDLEALGPGALRQGTASGPPPELRPPPTGVGLLDPEVRQAVERMASLLNASRPADAPLEAPTEDDEREDPFLGAEPTDMQGFDTPAIDHETVAADDLPLMGPTAFGVRLAAEVGRSGVRRKFTRLLAQLGDHLEPKDTNE